MSIETKLPLLIGGFLLAATISLSVAGYVAVRRNALATASERLSGIAQQFRQLFETQSVQLRGLAATAASRPELMAYARDPRPALQDAALKALVYTGPQPEAVLGSSVRSADGRISLSTLPADAAELSAHEAAWWSDSSNPAGLAAIGRYLLLDTAIVYQVSATVGGAVDVRLFQWRRLALSSRVRSQITQLLGADASLLMGNATDSLWTDLEHVIREPRGYADAVTKTLTRAHDGEEFIARAAPIAGTRWLVVAEMPMAGTLSTVNRYVRQVGFIALGVIMLGLLAAWRVSRAITEPLVGLTVAATTIARGGSSPAPRIDRADEIGHLAEAFGTMSSEVAHARAELEAKVEARTTDLNAALSQLREAQDSLVQREKLATLGQLASGVGHELRNPLGVMTNAVYYLRTVLAAQPENVREYLDILHQQIILSEKIVADLLDFARAKAPKRSPTDLRRLVGEQLKQLAATGTPGLKIVNELDESLPRVLTDSTQAGQVISNLLSNAAQAMEGGGTITLRASVVGEQLLLEVSDTGTGIAPENMARIFEPLFTTKARGIGLGLALSRTLARANGGDLHARNAPTKGAIFTFTLPVAPEAS